MNHNLQRLRRDIRHRIAAAQHTGIRLSVPQGNGVVRAQMVEDRISARAQIQGSCRRIVAALNWNVSKVLIFLVNSH
jgi:hypothetical protein